MTSQKIESDEPPNIELFRTAQFYIFLKNEYSLWWNRATGEFVAKTGWDLAAAVDPECLGICHGIIGKVQIDSVLEPQLMLIREFSKVGEYIDGNGIYKIKSVSFLQFTDGDNPNLTLCKKHQHSAFNKRGGIFDQKSPFAKTLGAVKSATNSIKTSTQQAAALAIPQVKFKFVSKDKEKFKKRLLEELNKIFTDTDSFYFSQRCDLTNSLQRQCQKESTSEAIWKSIDDRFFWNKFMVHEIINLNSPLCDPWITPVIQGFVQIENCKVEVGCDITGNEYPRYEEFKLILISRRSRHRAGTRYKRRGVDEDGHCANYVETEQILCYHHHRVSFVQTRGSVPVFWSQPGYKYRPPPRLDRGPAETQVVFEKHFTQEAEKYGPICVVNLVEQSGKEKIIWDAYTNHLLAYDDPTLTYATFDFHEYCRGMHFENVSYLLASLADVVRHMNYCWTDKQGTICLQNGVFRVNCIDCLDRTNVVQTAFAKAVMEIQLTKLGLIVPEGQMPPSVRNTFQLLWANNGDIISKQYAGTNALKGDYTRTGERKFTGLMKDGMNSANRYCRGHCLDSYRQAALDLTQGKDVESIDLLNRLTNEIALVSDDIINLASAIVPKHPPIAPIALAPEIEFLNAVYQVSRYYLSRFKDAYRQASIDMMLGNDITEDVFNTDNKQDEEDSTATAEHVKLLIEDCKKLLINDPAMILGSWGLIDADPVTGDPTETEMDTILILTKESYYVAEYDEQIDRVTKYQKVDLKELKLIELGPNSNMNQVSSVFKFNKNVSNVHHCIRIHYSVMGEDGYFHMFRSTNLRFFNNMAVVIKTTEEMLESLKAICETFTVALEIALLPPVMYIQGRPLDRKKSKVLDSGASCRLGSYLDLGLTQGLTRNVSETQLVALKSAGTKALTNISQQFSKINKLGQSLRRSQHQRPNAVYVTKDQQTPPVFSVEPIEDQKTCPTTSRRSSDGSEESGDLDLNKVNPQLKEKHIYFANVGILMKNESSRKKFGRTANVSPFIDNFSVSTVVESDNVTVRQKNPLLHSRTDLCFDSEKLKTSLKNYKESLHPKEPITPEKNKLTPPNSLQINRQLSHSANEIEDESKNQKTATSSHLTLDKRCSSEKDLTLNMVSSQSENALRSLKLNITNVITSPAAVTKDMLSPFSKIAKGVHNLGANLDPRKLKGGHSLEPAYKMTEAHLEEVKKLEERWKNSRTKLIAL